MRNYAWRGGAASRPAGPSRPGGWSYEDVRRKVAANYGQKVSVSSVNINAGADAAAALGSRFIAGNNDVRFAVIDAAQFRTLMEIDAQAAAGPSRMDANGIDQDAIVGTDARIANGWVANVAFADEDANTIDINDNPVALLHGKIILIDNGRYLTAVKAGRMQYWTEAAERQEALSLVDVPQDIEVPPAGRLLKFEKSLVQPDEPLVIGLEYAWKGGGR